MKISKVNKKRVKKPTIRQLMSDMKKLMTEREDIMKKLAEKDEMVEKLVKRVSELSYLTSRC